MTKYIRLVSGFPDATNCQLSLYVLSVSKCINALVQTETLNMESNSTSNLWVILEYYFIRLPTQVVHSEEEFNEAIVYQCLTYYIPGDWLRHLLRCVI